MSKIYLYLLVLTEVIFAFRPYDEEAAMERTMVAVVSALQFMLCYFDWW